ncbi:MAG: response regulator [Ignavibacteriae bacterium]|nr:response regulator [Ignavibacteriota bacterium]
MSERNQIKKEVSCKVLQTNFLACKNRGISLDKIIHNIPYSLEYLTNKHERIEWKYFLKIMRNMGEYFDLNEFEDAGRLHITPGFYPEGILAGMIFFSSNKFSRILAKKVFEIGDMMITCIKHEIGFPSKNNIFVKLYLDNNYETCPEFFISIKGYWFELGKIIGHKNFRINFDLIEQGATYNISWEKEGVLFNIKKRLNWLFNMKGAFADLTESHEELIKQYNELDKSKRILQKQATQLKIVNHISKSIKQNLDLKKTLNQITLTLINDAEFTYAKIKLSKDVDENKFEIESISGEQNQSVKTIKKNIEINNTKIGELLIQPKINSYELEIEELLNYLLPVINITIHDALVLRAITDYKDNLETKVENRTYELKNAQEKLSKTVQLLKEAQQTQNRFFTNISHEFRTPLTLIMGPAEQIIKQSKNSRVIEEAKLIYRSAKKINRLTNQLMDISKIESGKIKLKTSKQNLISILDENISLFRSITERKNISMNLSNETNEIYIYLDRDKLDKIIGNLLSNAIKFTPVGGYVNIEIKNNILDKNFVPECTKNLEFVEIAISDNGIGIPKEKLDKIFDRFYQVDNNLNREYEGTGIGLSLSRELVELHKGKIIVESEEGKGSTFRIFLPKGKNHLLPSEIIDTTSFSKTQKDYDVEDLRIEKQMVDYITFEPNLLSSNNEKPFLLIIEDNTEVRNYIKKNLYDHFNICEAVDGEDGWEKAINIMPDLIISDVMMPKMDGFELCKKIKIDESTSHIPVIMLTAKATLEDKISGFDIGADEYIMKPFEIEELKSRINNLLQQRKRLHEHYKKHQLFDIVDQKISSIDQKFISKVLELIKNNISNSEFTIELLAENLAVSRSLLNKKLSALVGHAPGELIKRIRLNKAADLLKHKSGNVTEISFEVGFNNSSYFTECFKKQFGVSPTQFQKQNH